MPTLEQKLADLQAKQQRIKDKIRKQDAAQKIVVGGAVIAHAKKNRMAALQLIELLEGIEREADKKRVTGLIEELKAGRVKGGSAGKSEPSKAQDAPVRTDFNGEII